MSEIHKTKQRLETELKRIDRLKSESDKKLILKVRDESFANGLSNNRVLFYLIRLRKLSEWTKKDLKDLNKDEIKALVAKIERKNYSERTKKGYKTAIKKFYQILEGYEWNSRKYPDKVEWIKTTLRKSKLKDPEVLSKEEIKRIFESAQGIFEKALATFMYESGCRSPDELLNMKVGDVELLNGKAKVKLFSGKVGGRKIIVVSCVPYLKDWIKNRHPDPKKDNLLWIDGDKPLNYVKLCKIVKRWAKGAGIEKRITPYTFRRTRATHLANKWPTPVLYKYMGWVQGSDVIQRYVALNEEDVEETVLSFYGMKAGKENNDIKPLFCPNCGQQNPPELEFCHFCGAPRLMWPERRKERLI